MCSNRIVFLLDEVREVSAPLAPVEHTERYADFLMGGPVNANA